MYIIYKSSSPCLTLVYSPYMVHAWVWRHYELIYDINMIILTISHDYWIYQFKNTWWYTYLMKYRIISCFNSKSQERKRENSHSMQLCNIEQYYLANILLIQFILYLQNFIVQTCLTVKEYNFNLIFSFCKRTPWHGYLLLAGRHTTKSNRGLNSQGLVDWVIQRLLCP